MQEDSLYEPDENLLSTAKISLGRQLFFDNRLSVDRTISCSSCHDPEKGFADGRPLALGVAGSTGRRNTPTIVNRAFSKEQFWDGRGADLEAQARGPILSPSEMGFSEHGLEERLNGIPGYRKQFKKVFGTGEIRFAQVVHAIAAFERTIFSGSAAVDRFAAGDSTAMTAGARRGALMFRGKANCFRCHVGFNFTDEAYHNIGVGFDAPSPDVGRYAITKEPAHLGTFKTPTLRDVALTGPYFHDGSTATLEEVIEYYDSGGIDNQQLDTRIGVLNLTPLEKRDLLEFLHALTGATEHVVSAPELPE